MVFSGGSPLMTETWMYSRFAHSKIIGWWTPGGYVLPISSCVAAVDFSRCCQICVV